MNSGLHRLRRREALLSTLFGAGCVGLRVLATGLPAEILLDPRRALADPCTTVTTSAGKAQYIILSTSGQGDPLNANVPGTYETGLNVAHAFPGQTLTMNGRKVTGGAPWTTLPQTVLDRTTFWHLMTNTPVHPKETDVLKLMGTTKTDEMLASLLAKQLAGPLKTIQAQPLCVGAASPTEGITFGGQALPIVPPLALKDTLTSPAGPLTSLQTLRDQALGSLYDLYKTEATAAARQYIDSLVTSQAQVRSIEQCLLDALGSITDNSPDAQIVAAVTMIQMNVSPVITIHIPFGGDNHRDVGLAKEISQTTSGVQTIAKMTSLLQSAGLSDRVTFMSLNVFGRTINHTNTDGRQHNPNHHVAITIGKPFKGGVVGGVTPVAGDYGCMPIDSATGAGATHGDIAPIQTLGSYGQTMLAAVGVDAGTISQEISGGKVIKGALAS